MSASDIPLRALFFRLQATMDTVLSQLTNTSSGGIKTVTYDTLEDLIAASGDDFDIATTSNYNPGDGFVGMWTKTDNPNLIPNGSDIVQLADGTVVLRYYSRESDGSSVTPVSGVSYSVSVPVAFPSITDFTNSAISAPLVISKDANGAMKIWLKDDSMDETGVETVEWVKNTTGVHYRAQ